MNDIGTMRNLTVSIQRISWMINVNFVFICKVYDCNLFCHGQIGGPIWDIKCSNTQDSGVFGNPVKGGIRKVFTTDHGNV